MTHNKKWNNQKKAAVGGVGGKDKTQQVIKVSQKKPEGLPLTVRSVCCNFANGLLCSALTSALQETHDCVYSAECCRSNKLVVIWLQHGRKGRTLQDLC